MTFMNLRIGRESKIQTWTNENTVFMFLPRDSTGLEIQMKLNQSRYWIGTMNWEETSSTRLKSTPADRQRRSLERG